MLKECFCVIVIISFLLTGCVGPHSGEDVTAEEHSPSISDFPADQERLSLLAENDSIWIQLSDSSTLSGDYSNVRWKADLSLVIYTQEGKCVQVISYGAYLTKETHLIDLIRNPSHFVSLTDTDDDGYDDLIVLTDDIPDGEAKGYRTFLWKSESGQFIEQQ